MIPQIDNSLSDVIKQNKIPNRTYKIVSDTELKTVLGEPTILTGSSIEIKDNAYSELDIPKVYGRSVQATRSGKNLFDINDISINNANSETKIVDNRIIITALGTTGAQYANKIVSGLESSKNYTFSFKAKKTVLGTDGLSVISIIVYGSNDGSTYTVLKALQNPAPVENKEYYFQETFTGYSSYRFFIYNNADTPVTIGEQTEYYDIQLEEGSVVTEYEPYGASPSPEFPSEIKSVGDEGTVTIEQREKNLFDDNKTYDLIALTYLNGIYSASDNDTRNTLQYKIQQYNNSTFLGSDSQVTKLITKTGKYYFTLTKLENANNIRIANSGTVKEFTLRYPLDDIDVGEKFTVVIDIIDATIGASKFKNVMLLRGEYTEETIPDYEPYFSKDYVIPLSAPLRSLPNGTKDTIEEDGIHRRVGSIVLDGSDDEQWGIYNSGNYLTNPYFRISVNNSKNGFSNILCSHLIGKNIQATTKNAIQFYAEQVMCQPSNEILTLAEWKTWLQQNLITVNYELAEEVIEPFNEFDNIQNIETLNKRIIYLDAISEVNPDIDAKYYSVENVSYEQEEVSRIMGFVDNLEAIKQSAYHILGVERYSSDIYDFNYGVELEQYIGQSLEYIEATIQDTLQEALTQDERILGVEVTEITQTSVDCVYIKFNLICYLDEIEMEVYINV